MGLCVTPGVETLMKKFIVAGLALTAFTVLGLLEKGWSASSINEAIAVINPASGSNVKGVVRFVQNDGKVKVTADIEGLEPGSEHGFHIHEFGDCSAPDATSAGSHYDAAGTKHHGKPMDEMRHTGDMGNIKADASGKVHMELDLTQVSVDGPQAPILGRGVIVHAKPDDFSQPVGNAGGRIGCGVIGVMKPSK